MTTEQIRPVDAPVLDNEAFYGLGGRIVRHLAPHTEADEPGMLLTLMAGFSAIIDSGPKVYVGRRKSSLSVWPLLMGPTNEGRKGTADEEVRPILEYVDPEFMEDGVSTSINTGEGLIFAIRDHHEKTDKESGETVLTGGIDDKRLLLIISEYANAMSKSAGGILSGVLRDAWDGKHKLEIKTKESETSTNPHVTVIGHVTPAEFSAKMKVSDMAGGSYNRLLPIYVHKSKNVAIPRYPAGWEDELEEMQQALRLAAEHAKGLKRIELTKAGEKLYEFEIYPELVRSDPNPVVQEFTARRLPYLMRLAGLYAVMNGRDKIGPKELRAGLAVIKYSNESAAYATKGQMVEIDQSWERAREKVLILLDEADEAGKLLPRERVTRTLSNNFSSQQIDDLIASVGATCKKRLNGGTRPVMMVIRNKKEDAS